MDRKIRIYKSFEEAEKAEIEAARKLSHKERFEVVHKLIRRIYSRELLNIVFPGKINFRAK